MPIKPNSPATWSIPVQQPRSINNNPSLPGPVGVARKRKNGVTTDAEGNTCDPFDMDEDGYCPEDES
jgi:hypothetical protein